MKISDLLRQVADIADSQETQRSQEQDIAQAAQAQEIAKATANAEELQAGQVAQLVQAAQNAKSAAAMSGEGPAIDTVIPVEEPSDEELTSADNTDNTDEYFMVPPLQQKHELLKKATDTENDVGKFADPTGDSEAAELQKLAGINPAALIVAADDSAEVD